MASLGSYKFEHLIPQYVGEKLQQAEYKTNSEVFCLHLQSETKGKSLD